MAGRVNYNAAPTTPPTHTEKKVCHLICFVFSVPGFVLADHENKKSGACKSGSRASFLHRPVQKWVQGITFAPPPRVPPKTFWEAAPKNMRATIMISRARGWGIDRPPQENHPKHIQGPPKLNLGFNPTSPPAAAHTAGSGAGSGAILS